MKGINQRHAVSFFEKKNNNRFRKMSKWKQRYSFGILIVLGHLKDGPRGQPNLNWDTNCLKI